MDSVKLFVSAPIAGFENDIEYVSYRELVCDLIERIKNSGSTKEIYSALSSIKSPEEYDSPQVAATQDLSELDRATHFIMFYPQKTPTSSLIELGVALAKNKKVLIVVNNIDDLPFMAQGLNAPPYCVQILQKPINQILLEDLFHFFEN